MTQHAQASLVAYQIPFAAPGSWLMHYDQASQLLRHPGLRLLRAQHAPLLISFLLRMFKTPHRLSLLRSELEAALADTLFGLNEARPGSYPLPAAKYLDDWTQSGFLRKYYQAADEPEYELTAEAEQTLTWLQSLEARDFVGTESRLQTIFTRLREIVEGTDLDRQRRIEALERQRADLELKISLLRAGQIERLDARRIREYWQEARDTARRLLADFRAVESNFRCLDQDLRAQISTGPRGRGQVLGELFAGQDRIEASDQGQSFQAFWEFLMDLSRQEELGNLLETIGELPEIEADELMSQLRGSLIQAADRVKRIQSHLYAQLRRFFESRRHLEQQMLNDLILQIEQGFMQVRQQPPPNRQFWHSDELRPEFALAYERQPFVEKASIRLQSQAIELGQAEQALSHLLTELSFDPAQLRARLDQTLAQQLQVSLAELLQRWPPRHGLEELVAWIRLALASPGLAFVYPDQPCQLELDESDQRRIQVTLPLILFRRPADG